MAAIQKFIILLLLTCLFSCVKPTSNDSISWKVKYSVPLLKEKITISEFLKGQILGLKIQDDTSQIGDTLRIVKSDSFVNVYNFPVVSVNSYEDSVFPVKLLLQKLPPLEWKFPTPQIPNVPLKLFKSSSYETTELIPFEMNLPITLPSIDKILIDTNQLPIPLLLKNISSYLKIVDLAIILESKSKVIANIDSIREILPLSEISNRINLAGAVIEDSLTMHIKGVVEKNKSQIISNFDSLIKISIDMNGLSLKAASLIDSLLLVKYDFNYNYLLSEKNFEAFLVDIDTFALPLEIVNSTPIKFLCKATIQNLWDQNYCKQREIGSVANLSNRINDSAYFMGNRIPPLQINAGTTIDQSITKLNIKMGPSRFFGAWNEKHGVSYMPIKLEGFIGVDGRKISVDKNMALRYKIGQATTCFSKIEGQYHATKEIPGTWKTFPVSTISNASLGETLRKKCNLTSTDLKVNIVFPFGDSTTLEHLDNSIIIAYGYNQTFQYDTVNFTLLNVRNNRSSLVKLNLGSIINSFPDSISYIVNSSFPPFTKLSFDYKTFLCLAKTVALDISAKINLDLTLSLAWEIQDSVYIATPISKIDLRKISSQLAFCSDKRLIVDYKIRNSTNLNGKIFTVSMPIEQKNLLAQTKAFDIPKLAADSQKVISLFGTNGVSIPPRNQQLQDSIILSSNSLTSLSSWDSTFLRSAILLIPNKSDALHDTDNIFIDATLSLEGIQTMGDK